MRTNNVTKSANNALCLTISFNPCKCKKPGALIRHLYGLFVEFETKKTPNSPFGASTVVYVSSIGILKPSVYNLKWCIKDS